MRSKEAMMKKKEKMVKALIKFIKEGIEPSPPKPTIISKPPISASLNPFNPTLVPLLPLKGIEVNFDALSPVMEGNCEEKEDVHEAMTIKELFNQKHLDTTSVTKPTYVEDLICVLDGSSRHMIIEDEAVVMED